MYFCLQPSFDDVLVETLDGVKKIDVERTKPEDLVPFEVTKVIAKSQVDEFKAVHIDLNKDKAIAIAHMNKASRAIDLASSAMQGFFSAFRRNRVFNPAWSQPRKRWVGAIRKVIVQNSLAAIKIRLANSALAAAVVVKPTQPAHHMVTAGLVVVAKNRFLGLRRKRSFCDERLGLSSNSNGNGNGNSGSFGYTSSKMSFNGSFGRFSSKPNLASIDHPTESTTTSNLRKVGRAATSNSAAELWLDVERLALAPLVLPISAGKKSIGGRKGSFDDSQLKEMGVAAGVATKSANEDLDEFVQMRVQRQREREGEKAVYEMLDQQDIDSVMSIFAPGAKTLASPGSALPPLRSTNSSSSLSTMDSPKPALKNETVRPRALLIPRSTISSSSPSTATTSRPGSASSSRASARSPSPSCSSSRTTSPGGRRMSRGSSGIDLSAESFDKLVLGISTDSSGSVSPSPVPSTPSHSRSTAAQDARNADIRCTSPSLSRQNSRLSPSPSSKTVNNSGRTTPRSALSRENSAERGSLRTAPTVSSEEYLHYNPSVDVLTLDMQSVGIAGSSHSPPLKPIKRADSLPRSPITPAASNILTGGTSKVVTPSSTDKRRASHLSAMKVLRQKGASSDSEDTAYCSDYEIASLGRSADFDL
eukprot:gene27314-34011_t